MNTKYYKWCAVPLCKNTSISTPNLLFVYVPNDKIMRAKWLKLARRNPEDVVTSSSIYFCEDHFDLPNDMENYMQYHIMGSVAQVRMKTGCVPKKFECQAGRKTGAYIRKKRKKRKLMILDDCEKQLEERSISTELGEMAFGSSESIVQPNSSKESAIRKYPDSSQQNVKQILADQMIQSAGQEDYFSFTTCVVKEEIEEDEVSKMSIELHDSTPQPGPSSEVANIATVPALSRCRCCLAPGDSHALARLDTQTLADNFNVFLCNDERLPNLVCDSCSAKLSDMMLFRQTVLASELQLTQALTDDFTSDCKKSDCKLRNCKKSDCKIRNCKKSDSTKLDSDILHCVKLEDVESDADHCEPESEVFNDGIVKSEDPLEVTVKVEYDDEISIEDTDITELVNTRSYVKSVYVKEPSTSRSPNEARTCQQNESMKKDHGFVTTLAGTTEEASIKQDQTHEHSTQGSREELQHLKTRLKCSRASVKVTPHVKRLKSSHSDLK